MPLIQYPIHPFLNATRVWQTLYVRRTSGLVHENVLAGGERPNPSRDLRLRCPACPEIGVNLDHLDVRNTPFELQHTIQQWLTNDGNFQFNQYKKRRETVDHSFWDGKGYFPGHSELLQYLQNVDGRVEVHRPSNMHV